MLLHKLAYCDGCENGTRVTALMGDRSSLVPPCLVYASPDLFQPFDAQPGNLDEIMHYFQMNSDVLVPPMEGAPVVTITKLLPIHPQWGYLFLEPRSPRQAVEFAQSLMEPLSPLQRQSAQYFVQWISAAATLDPASQEQHSLVQHAWETAPSHIQDLAKWCDGFLQSEYPTIYGDMEPLIDSILSMSMGEDLNNVVDGQTHFPAASVPKTTRREVSPEDTTEPPEANGINVILGKRQFREHNEQFETKAKAFFLELLRPLDRTQLEKRNCTVADRKKFLKSCHCEGHDGDPPLIFWYWYEDEHSDRFARVQKEKTLILRTRFPLERIFKVAKKKLQNAAVETMLSMAPSQASLQLREEAGQHPTTDQDVVMLSANV